MKQTIDEKDVIEFINKYPCLASTLLAKNKKARRAALITIAEYT